MNKIYVCIVCFLLFASTAFAQVPTIEILEVKPTCLNTLYSIPVKLTGTFNQNNSFIVQLKKDTYSTDITEIPATLNNNNIELRITDPTLSLQSSLYIRIVATSPHIESAWNYSFKVLIKGNINISSYRSDSINKTEPYIIRFSGNSNSDVKLTLYDSTKIYFSSNYSDGLINYTENLLADKSTTYKIAHAENGCGKMDVSGEAKVYINPVSVLTTFVSPFSACPGSELKVNFSVQDGSLPASAKFKIRLIEQNPPEGKEPVYIDLPATLHDNILTAMVPEGLTVNKLFYFKASVLVDNPGIVGAPGNLYFFISPKPSVVFTSPSQTIDMGAMINLEMLYTGPGTFNIHLSDDSNIYYSDDFQTSNNVSLQKRPLVTTEYTIKSIETGCTQAVQNKQSVRITVNPGLYLDEINPTKIYCEDEIVKLHFVTNTAVNAGTTFSMEITENYLGRKISVPVKREGNYVEFKIPRFPNTETNGSRQAYVFQLVALNPSLKSYPTTGLIIQSVPTIRWSDYNVKTFPGPTTPSLGYTLVGGGPYTSEYENGRKSTFSNDGYGYADIYVPETGIYGIKSISNSCFKNESPPKISLQVENPESPTPYISATPLGFRICNGDSIEIDLRTSGNFNDGNVFNVEVTPGSYCCSYQTFTTLNKAGKIKVKIPEDARAKISDGTYSYNLRIASTNPVVFSDRMVLQVDYPLYNISVDYYDAKDNLFTPDLKSYGLIRFMGGTPTSAVVSDGKNDTDVLLTRTGFDYTFPISPSLGNNVFTVKTITSFCGIQPVNIAKPITVIPYRISIPGSYQNMTICAGSSIMLPFLVEDGSAPNATFSLQIAKNGSSDFVNLITNVAAHYFLATIPENYSEGEYLLRIISSENAISYSMKINVAVPASGELNVQYRPDVTNINITAGESIYFNVNLSGSLPVSVTADGLGKADAVSSPLSYSVSPLKSGEFKLLAVSNACGYGKISGTYMVKIVPTLTVLPTFTPYCSGGSLLLNYSLKGDFDLTDDYIRFELIDQKTQKHYSLDSTKTASGAKDLKIPASLPAGTYYLRTSIKKYDLKYEFFVDLASAPDVYLAGNSTINPGAQAGLAIKNRRSSGNQEISFQLSDGTSGKFYDYSMGTYVSVSPLKTTTYTITSVSNACGAGVSSGSAIVEVNPPSDRSVDVKSWAGPRNAQTCTGDSIQVYFSAKGGFSSGNKFTVQISDTTGANFRSITTIGAESPLTAYLPADLLRGSGYRIRVIASDAGTASGTFQEFITLKVKPKARFSSDIVGYQPNINPKAVVLLEGDAPWNYTYGTDVMQYPRYSTSSVDSLELYQASPSVYYKLFNVSNVCGLGTIGTPSAVRVEVVTGTENPILSEIKVFPNPTHDLISVSFENQTKKNISVYSSNGILTVKKQTRAITETIDISQYPSGIYILKIESEGRSRTFKIVKE